MTTDASEAIAILEARIEKLTEALLYVAGELWVTRDRVAILEHVLTEGGVTAPGVIDGLRPDAALTEKLTADREAFMSSVLSYLAPEG